jgi:MFS transporter, DHA3 family, macrolide efflux protein
MSVFQNQSFRNVLIASAISGIGDGFHSIAAMWWVKVHTGSDALVASVALAKGLTSVVLAPFAGALVDRLDRRTVMLYTNLARGLIVALLTLLAMTEQLEPWTLIVSSAFLAALGTLFGPAFGASIPNIVGKENLAPANSALQISGTLAGIAGPALGGLTVAGIGSSGAFLVDALSFLLSALFILISRIPSPARVTAAKTSSLFGDVAEGWNWLRGQRLMFGILLLALGLNFVVAPIQVLFPGYAKDVLMTDARGFGLLETGIPIGFLLGAVLLGVLKPKAIGAMIVASMCAFGLLLVGVGLSRFLPLSLGFLVIGGAMLALINISLSVVFQSRIPNEMQGRVFGVMQTLSGGLQPLGLALAPLLIVLLGGIPNVMIVIGALAAVSGLSFLALPGFLALRHESAPPTPGNSSDAPSGIAPSSSAAS